MRRNSSIPMKTPERKEGNLLCVANFPATTGYAWDFIGNLYARIADHLATHGIKTFVAYPSMPAPPAALAGSAAQPIVLDTSLITKRSVRETLDFVRKEKIKVVYFTDRLSRHWKYLYLRWSGVGRIIVHDHTSGERTRPRGLKRAAKWVLARVPGIVADQVIAVSDYVARRQLDVGMIPAQRVCTVWNGLPVPPLQDTKGEAARVSFNIAPDRSLIMCGCRAAPEKGVAHLLRAFDRAVRDSPPGRTKPVLLFLGDGPHLPQLRSLRESLSTKEDIILAGYRREAKELLASADLCVVPSVWQDAFPLAVLEAMARAKPVVATRVGGIPEMIEHGVHGLLVPPGDEASLASAISRLLDDSQLAGQLARAARRRVQEQFTPEEQLRRLIAILEAGFGTPCNSNLT